MTAPTPAAGTTSARTIPKRRLLLGLTAVVAAGGLAAGTVLPAAAAAPVTAGAAQHRHDPLQRDLDQLVADDGFPGVLLTVQSSRGRTTHYTAGVGDLTTRERVPVDGLVRFASNSKTFVAIAVLQLVGEGKVALDAPVETYLPGLVHGDGVDGNRITVRQLLQHRSGLPDYLRVLLANGFDPVRHTYVQPRALLDQALTLPADFEPGTQWAYSNTNYVVAGLLVEKVTGRPLHEVITERVIQKAGLRHTYAPAVGEQTLRGRHPQGYDIDVPAGTPPTDVTDLDPAMAWAAGDLVGPPSDLVRLYTALLGGTLLRPAELAEMKTTVETIPEWQGDRYGLGLVEHPLPCGGVAWGHGGDIFGYETRDGVTEDGRGAAIAVTAEPTSEAASQHVGDALDAALCG